MTINGGRDEEIQQVNHVKDEYRGDVNLVVGNEPGSRRYAELKISEVDENVQSGQEEEAVQGNAVSQAPPQQPQGSLVHWERFLHVRSIKVMLVENDDSTRHIVTALLRNCNYEVIEAANGFQAWKILEDLSNHIDIVLTEVVMPCLSGIGLLCKIMSHKTRKNIPVIMMSSHDSMGLVFKCLSKGAVDFLLKPIRKNELKNLWQHVWRRCHSSSGSGSESGTHAQRSVNSKNSVRSNGSGSIRGDDIESTEDGSDDGSGTQSSWTKQAVELESPQAASPCDQITECPDSTCGIVIRPAETRAAMDFHDQDGQPDHIENGKKLEVGGSKDSEMQTEFPVKVPIIHNGVEQNTTQNIKSKGKGLAEFRENSPNKHISKDCSMPGTKLVNGEFNALKEPEKVVDTNTKVIDDPNGITVNELSLKRPRGVKDEEKIQSSRNILRHSELSAFTRYNTSSNALKMTRGITASSSQPNNRSEVMKKELSRDANSDGYFVYQGSIERSIPTKADDIPRADQDVRVQHIHHHHHVHHYHNIETEDPMPNHEDAGLKELAANASHCGSSNVLGGLVEVNNVENCSMNRSGSGSKHGSGGSKHGSNGQIGSSNAVNLEGTNFESSGGLGAKSGNGDASVSGSETRIDQHKSAHREAALAKFRQKRKERCFQKKVRYQNRKTLADQRPRVRGQFVKSSSNAVDS